MEARGNINRSCSEILGSSFSVTSKAAYFDFIWNVGHLKFFGYFVNSRGAAIFYYLFLGQRNLRVESAKHLDTERELSLMQNSTFL